MQTVDFRFFPLREGDVVLDLGCGEGRHAIAVYEQGAVQSVGVDLATGDLRTAREKFLPFRDERDAQRSFGLTAADALSLPFADNTFDRVICSEVLEHIPDFAAVLDEIRRVLKPDGLFCASVPRRWPEKICWRLSSAYHLVPGGHLRIFRESELRQAIELRGFTRYHRHGAHALHTPFWWLKCLFWNSQESNWLVRQYHRLLVWDLLQAPRLTRSLERWLNPLLGKSVVLYFRKEALS